MVNVLKIASLKALTENSAIKLDVPLMKPGVYASTDQQLSPIQALPDKRVG
ncbi:MAG: hypothetical protein HGA59_08465 [Chlorobiaceae bacterium]|jgi:hypothetical protein|nr:hypothetical protein [Chlorobiaceae bacterium]NTV15876.1 hypothetical protein [Chlorobiaceae bacterium]